MAARKDKKEADKDKDESRRKEKKARLSLGDKLKSKGSGGSKGLADKIVKKAKLNTNFNEKEKSQTKSTPKPEANRTSTGGGGGKSSGCYNHLNKSRRSRRPGRPRRQCGSDDDSDSGTDHEGGLTPESAEKVYSATYVEDYIDCIEHLDGVSRSTSKIVQNHCELVGILNEVESELFQLLGEDDANLDLDNLTQRQKDAIIKMDELLQQSSSVGDLSSNMSNDVSEVMDEKLRILKIDSDNLDRVLGKSDNKTPKSGISNLKKVSINPEPLRSSARSHGSIFDPGRIQAALANPLVSSLNVSAGDVYTLDKSLLEDCTRYRTCKFRNPPQYVPTITRPTKIQSPTSQDKKSATDEKVESAKKNSGTQLKKSSSATKIQTGKSVANSESAGSDTTSASGSGEENSSDEPTYCICNKVRPNANQNQGFKLHIIGID
ncbi:hypothetical protein Ocin01_08621 [Orchesella cincta]|uniref:Uncharacterized protein n=1 Tax=Orchesella cincta TaxID=48709 RepID=A0A1D2MYJ8_ORCCI|nr:hypothetical protein Ocin01_08621 [Orchesella cincta]